MPNTPGYDLDLTQLRAGQIIVVKEDTHGWDTVLQKGLRLIVRELSIEGAGSPVDAITADDLADDGPFDPEGASMLVCFEDDPSLQFFIGYECICYPEHLPDAMPQRESADLQRLHTLCSDLGEVESEISRLNAERDTIRAEISVIIERLGGKTTLPGYGRLEITAPALISSYDRKQIDALVAELQHTYPEVAAQLEACRKESARSGGLRITPER